MVLRRAVTAALASVLLALAALLLLPAPHALAHASLVSSSPSAGDAVDGPLDSLALAFSEPIEPSAATFRLLTLEGDEVETAWQVREGDSRAVVVTPKSPLDSGSFTMAWKVVSTDGHIVGGVVPFAIGDSSPVPSPPPAEDSEPLLDRLLEALSWLAGIAAALLLVGSRRNGVVVVLASVALVGSATRVAILGLSLPSTSGFLATGDARGSSVVALAAAIALFATALSGPARMALAALALTSFAAQGLLNGHALVDAPPIVPLANSVHLAAGALWAGAVLALALAPGIAQAARTRRTATAAIAILIPAASLTAIALSGALSGEFAWNAWSLVLAAKCALVAAALCLGLVNHLRLSPSRVEATLGNRNSLRSFLLVELCVLVFVVGMSAALGVSRPPALEASAPPVSQPAAVKLTTGAAIGDFPVAFPDLGAGTLSGSSRAGAQIWELRLPFAPDPSATLLEVVAEHPRSGVERVTIELALEPDGVYRGSGPLPVLGEWDVTVLARPDPFSEKEGTARVMVKREEAPNGP